MAVKQRIKPREGSFPWDSLTFIDRASLQWGKPGMYSLTGGPRSIDRIKTDSDLKAAWEQNGERFMAMQSDPAKRVSFAQKPGERPAPFWWFDAPGTPREGEQERDALERLGCIDDAERLALQRFDNAGERPGLGKWDGSRFEAAE